MANTENTQGETTSAPPQQDIECGNEGSGQSNFRRHSIGDETINQFNPRTTILDTPSTSNDRYTSNYRSRGIPVSTNTHPMERTPMSSIHFDIDATKGLIFSLEPPSKPTRQIQQPTKSFVRKIIPMETLVEDAHKPSSDRRPCFRRSHSDGNVSACFLPSRGPIQAISKYESQRSLVSELTGGGDLKTIQQEQSTWMGPSTIVRKRRAMIAPGQTDFPNNPHNSLEFPPLYFLTRGSEFALKLVRDLIRFRWTLSYPLQRRVPFSKLLRKMNVFCTWGELLMILPFFSFIVLGALYSFVWPDLSTSISISGHAARTPLIFAFCTAMRNSYLTLLIGIPFERALWYHKLSARLAYVNGILHTYVCFFYSSGVNEVPIYTRHGDSPNFGRYLFQDDINIGGTMLLVSMTCMILTALPYVRHRVFEIFYYLHVIFAGAMISCAFFHTGFLVPMLAAITWGFDLFVRKVYMAAVRYPQKAQIRTISDSVVEVCFPKANGFDYNPGQYVYIAIPEIDFFQWHPFSLSSSPEQKAVTLHIRKAGSWTTALYDMASTSHEINMLMEGPYGAVGVDLMSDRYKTVMLFSGGIGVTPMQAICNQLMYEQNKGKRKLNKVSMVWIERDPNVTTKIDAVRRTSQIISSTFHGKSDYDSDGSESTNSDLSPLEGRGLASTLLTLVPASGTTDEQLEEHYPDIDGDGDDESFSSVITDMIRSRFATTNNYNSVNPNSPNNANEDTATARRRQTILEVNKNFDDDTFDQSFLDEAYQTGDNSVNAVLDLQVYLTAKNTLGAIGELPFVRKGRPDIKEIFQKTRQEAIARGEKRVAVCVCAPRRIVNLCQRASVKFSDSQLTFDFHHEVFD